MVNLQDLFGLDYVIDIQKMFDQGFIRQQNSHDRRLGIYNYTERAQFAREWNPITLACRGLIVDMNTQHGTIVARPFPKFFNWDDSSQPYPPTGTCIRMPKMDGSLGILYRHPGDGRVSVATRGSFHSEQAVMATSMLGLAHFGDAEDRWINIEDLDLDRFTYLCEIIYPGNRIVVNYGDRQSLTLLDVIDKETGKSDLAEFDRVQWRDKVEKKLIPTFQDTMAGDIPPGDEGFVFYWPAKDFRVKMKAAEYIEIHRMIFGMNERTVWQAMTDGKTIEDVIDGLPDEFHQWVRDVWKRLKVKANDIQREIYKQYAQVVFKVNPDGLGNYTRKQFAQEATKYPHKSYLFMIEDGKSADDVHAEVFKTLRPVGGKGIVTQSEDTA